MAPKKKSKPGKRQRRPNLASWWSCEICPSYACKKLRDMLSHVRRMHTEKKEAEQEIIIWKSIIG